MTFWGNKFITNTVLYYYERMNTHVSDIVLASFYASGKLVGSFRKMCWISNSPFLFRRSL